MKSERKYKTSEKEREYQRQYYRKNIEKYRKYKQEQMKRMRANPQTNEGIKARTREWYRTSGRAERQKEYLEKFKIERFFKWRVRLFNQHYGTKHTETDFIELWNKQKGICPFTGWTLDKTAQIDHIIPIKREGTSSLSNLRWLCKEANYGKRDMLDGEYLNVIEAIVKNIKMKCD